MMLALMLGTMTWTASGPPRALRLSSAPLAARRIVMDEFMDSLRSRISQTQSADTVPVLGVEDIGADQMGPADVVEHVMKSLRAGPEQGFTAMLQFSLSFDDCFFISDIALAAFDFFFVFSFLVPALASFCACFARFGFATALSHP